VSVAELALTQAVHNTHRRHDLHRSSKFAPERNALDALNCSSGLANAPALTMPKSLSSLMASRISSYYHLCFLTKCRFPKCPTTAPVALRLAVVEVLHELDPTKARRRGTSSFFKPHLTVLAFRRSLTSTPLPAGRLVRTMSSSGGFMPLSSATPTLAHQRHHSNALQPRPRRSQTATARSLHLPPTVPAFTGTMLTSKGGRHTPRRCSLRCRRVGTSWAMRIRRCST